MRNLITIAAALACGSAAASPIQEFSIQPHPSGPAIVAAAKDGSVWFAAPLASEIMHYDKDGKKLAGIKLGEGSFPVGVAIDGSGTIWFTDAGKNTLNSYQPRTKTRRSYPVPTEGAWPFFVAIDSKNRIWFTERGANKVGRFDPRSNRFIELDIPRKLTQPAGLTITSDDHVFFSQNSGHRIGHIAPGSTQVREIAVPSKLRADPHFGLAGLHAAPDGDIWFAELDGRLGRIPKAPGGYQDVQEYPVPNSAARPAGVYVDNGGCIWFTELDGNRIVRFDPSAGSFSGFEIPTGRPDPEPRAAPERTARGEVAQSPKVAAQTSRPFGITGDKRGAIWFTEQYGHKLARLSYAPRSCQVALKRVASLRPEQPEGASLKNAAVPGVVHGPSQRLAPSVSFPLPQPDSVPGVIEADPAGGVWFTQVGGFPLPGLGHLPPGEKLGRIDLSGKIEEFRTPTPGSAPTSLKVAADGSVWFTERLADKIGVWDPTTRSISEIDLKAPGANPVGIALDERRQRVWFTARGIGKIGYFDKATRQVTLIDTPSRNSEPSTIALDWNGDVWFDERAANTIVRLHPETGEFKTFVVPTPDARIVGVTPDAKRRKVWFVELATSKLGALDVESGTIQEFPLPSPKGFPFKLAIGARGEIYVSQVFGNSIAIWDGTSFTELLLRESRSLPGGVTLDTQHNLWFTEQSKNRVSMIPHEELLKITRGDHEHQK